MPDKFSPTQLTTYLACSRKYRFRYLDKREPESRSAALALGTAIHSGIEWYWRQRIEGRSVTIADAQRMFRVDWMAQLAGGDIDFDGKEPSAMKATGETLITLFIERFGVMDFLSPGGVGELKTAARRTEPSAWSLQLSAYSFAMREKTGRGHKLRVIELITTKEPKLEVHEVAKTEADKAWFHEVARGALAGIARGAFHPIPSWICPRCEFKRACYQA